MAIHNPIKGFISAVVAKMMHTTTGAVSGSVPMGIVIWIITFAVTVTLMVLIVRFKKRLYKQKTK